jgi:sec-independent protein translocase protein TatA
MIGLLGPEDLLIVVAIVALLFGGKKLPELARSLGRAKTEFRAGLKEGEPADPSKEHPESASSGSPPG